MGTVLSKAVWNVIGNVYPVYCSLKALKESNRQEQIRCLTFWSVVACFSFLESLLDPILSATPLYYEAKLGFLCWLTIPQFCGAEKLYQRYLKPCYLKYEKRLETFIETLRRQFLCTISYWMSYEGNNSTRNKAIDRVQLYSAGKEEEANRDPKQQQTIVNTSKTPKTRS